MHASLKESRTENRNKTGDGDILANGDKIHGSESASQFYANFLSHGKTINKTLCGSEAG